MNHVLFYTGSVLMVLLGLVHLASSKPALSGFGSLEGDNARMLRVQWIIAGMSLVFTGILMLLLTYFGGEFRGCTRMAGVTCVAFTVCTTVVALIFYVPAKAPQCRIAPIVLSLSTLCFILGLVL